MNECFVIGKIITDIEFKFIYNSKKTSIVTFNVELRNKSIVKVKAYDDNADYCYRNLNKNEMIFIYGKLGSKDILFKKVIKV